MSQPDWEVEAWYLPAWQSMQEAVPPIEYLPAPHESQLVLAAFEYLPAAHVTEQSEDASWKVVLVAASVSALPAAHREQPDEPVASSYLRGRGEVSERNGTQKKTC
jgi:hypothetical protein